MASPQLQPEYLTAGEDYLAALVRLGMRPRYLGWGWETLASQWQLVLVTSILDAGGPLALNRLLFKAYNAEATPKLISPFIVRVFSPEIVPQDFYLLGAKDLRIETVKDKFGREKDIPEAAKKIENYQTTFFGLEMQMKNSYANVQHTHPGYHHVRQEWQRFKKNVEKLAA